MILNFHIESLEMYRWIFWICSTGESSQRIERNWLWWNWRRNRSRWNWRFFQVKYYFILFLKVIYYFKICKKEQRIIWNQSIDYLHIFYFVSVKVFTNKILALFLFFTFFSVSSVLPSTNYEVSILIYFFYFFYHSLYKGKL